MSTVNIGSNRIGKGIATLGMWFGIAWILTQAKDISNDTIGFAILIVAGITFLIWVFGN